jgi:hypothetical protein
LAAPKDVRERNDFDLNENLGAPIFFRLVAEIVMPRWNNKSQLIDVAKPLERGPDWPLKKP